AARYYGRQKSWGRCILFDRYGSAMLTLLLMTLAAGPLSDSLDRGIPASLGRERAAAFSAVRYALAFTLPVNRQQPVEGTLRLTLTLAVPGRIVIDFSA